MGWFNPPHPNKFRGSTNQPDQLTLESTWYYLHLAPILDVFILIWTFTMLTKFANQMFLFFVQSGHFGQVARFCFEFMSRGKEPVLIFWSDFDKKIEIFQKSHSFIFVCESWVLHEQVQDWCRVEIISCIFKCKLVRLIRWPPKYVTCSDFVSTFN